MDWRRTAGILAFAGAVQLILGMLIAEFLYPGYSNSQNYISDLGATCRNTCVIYEPTATIFNTSVILLGIFMIVIAYALWREFGSIVFSVLVGLSGLGAAGVGLFPETYGWLHFVVSFMVFFFGGLSAVESYWFVKAPFSYFSVVLGLASLAALAVFGLDMNLGLGPGGMERMIAYPVLLWGVGFGSYLMHEKVE
ncbi:MAG TPA: DUF998 domain-containing protein [Candidatus Methanoperedenaceae archaeon]|nr:DUF998 domain-containing protein [Candidatus Methanoperedenaceae archaeon]